MGYFLTLNLSTKLLSFYFRIITQNESVLFYCHLGIYFFTHFITTFDRNLANVNISEFKSALIYEAARIASSLYNYIASKKQEIYKVYIPQTYQTYLVFIL